MKSTGNVRNRSRFWPRLLGALIACSIIALLVFGGVNSVMNELSDVYDALAASQAEAAYTKARLNDARLAIAQKQNELSSALQDNERQSRQLQLGGEALAEAHSANAALTEERDDLKRGLNEAVGLLIDAERLYKAAVAEKQAANAELERIRQQPKISVVMTTERKFAMSQRETFAASRQQFFAEGDGGMVYYASAKAFHEKEQHAVYTERSQVILTQTGPGDDVLRCLQDGCAMVLAAHQSAMRMERHAYQAQYVSSEMMLTEGRRGRRPGRRR